MTTWRESNAIYQIYPRSFQDSNGDGVGDLNGIISRLDYLSTTLGVDAIWISPFFPSPQQDFGYDVSDYCNVDPSQGTLKHFKHLLDEAHRRDLKVMIDFVPNHTSDLHIWFQEARSSRDNPMRDYYVWRDQPNNWISLAGGSAWTYDEATEQYYLHSFMSSQPDLNWDNPVVRDEMKNALRFWLNMGVDGFRVDAVWPLSKDPDFADDPVSDESLSDDNFGKYIHSKCRNGPHLYEYLAEMSNAVAEYDDCFMVFEYYSDYHLGDSMRQVHEVHAINPDVSSPFFFDGIHAPWHAEEFGKLLTDYISGLSDDARPVICFSNHDQSRMVTRFGRSQAKVLAMMQMTLPGTPCMYYGEELGMEDVDTSAEATRDNFEANSDMGGRDPYRTPMQWDSTKYAGFSSSHPWLPVDPDHITENVADELADVDSSLNFYRMLLSLRRNNDALIGGDFRVVDVKNGYVLAYERSIRQEKYLVLLNFADSDQIVTVDQSAKVVMSISKDDDHEGVISVTGYGGIILRY